MSNMRSVWSFQSISRKIGGLSSVLLGFLFVVIVYSVIKLQQISMEMREVARIDIPLTEVVSELEVLQLEKHIVFEQIRFKTQEKTDAEIQAKIAEERRRFHDISVRVKQELTQAEDIIKKGIASGSIEEKLEEHQQVLTRLTEFQKELMSFKLSAQQVFDVLHEQDSRKHWQMIEQELALLDEKAVSLVIDIEKLTEEISENTERHETEFFYVNTALGVSALVIGVYLTLYIINSFRRRVGQLQGDLETLSEVISSGKQHEETTKIEVKTDEFAGLANSMNAVIERFSDELHNRYEVEHQLLQLATTDKLTGAYNRHKWDESLEAEALLAKRGSLLSMMLIDLDHFKAVNDTHGHDVGDKVLAKAVQLIKSAMRESDMVFRLGGEEFAVLMRNQQADDVWAIAEKVRLTLEQSQVTYLPTVTASIGIAHFQQNESSVQFVKRADEAVYQAKHNGRNQVVLG